MHPLDKKHIVSDEIVQIQSASFDLLPNTHMKFIASVSVKQILITVTAVRDGMKKRTRKTILVYAMRLSFVILILILTIRLHKQYYHSKQS